MLGGCCCERVTWLRLSVCLQLQGLRPTLAELQASFGSCIMDSVVVVASKMNEKPGETGEKKLRGMKQVGGDELWPA